tara:strand:- start:1199 stop:1780 length:582 start_codon:yes stop_codon:yes gene_type:complete
MNALEKYAAKAKLTARLAGLLSKAKGTAGSMASKTKQYGRTVRGKNITEAQARLEKAQKAQARTAAGEPKFGGKGSRRTKKRRAKVYEAHVGKASGRVKDVGKATKGVGSATKATAKARKQVGAGFAGLAGLGALGLGARAIGKRSASKQAIKGTQSAVERLGQFAKKNKRELAIGGGAAGGAAVLGSILKSK